MTNMIRRARLGLLLLPLLALPVRAQEGIDVDPLPPALGAGDAFTTREARLEPGTAAAGVGLDWSWHLLRDNLATGGEWLADQRLRIFAGGQVVVGRKLRLAVVASYLPWQRGRRYDELGQLEPLGAGSGEAWLTMGWAPLATDRVAALLECGLRLPAASPAALAGEPDWGTRFALLLSLRGWLGSLLANLGVTTRRRTLFRNLVWDDGWHVSLAGRLGPPGWPLWPVLEMRAEGVLARPGDSTLLAAQGLAGVRLDLGRYSLLLGAGRGIYGLLTPAWRVFARLAVSAGGEKNAPGAE